MAAERDDKKGEAQRALEAMAQLADDFGLPHGTSIEQVATHARYLQQERARLSVARSAVTAFSPPTEKEIAAYRDLFRRELDKNMHNSSGSPSTDAHHVALHAFVEARNRRALSATAPRRCREGADRDCSPACEEKSRTYCSWKGF